MVHPVFETTSKPEGKLGPAVNDPKADNGPRLHTGFAGIAVPARVSQALQAMVCRDPDKNSFHRHELDFVQIQKVLPKVSLNGENHIAPERR